MTVTKSLLSAALAAALAVSFTGFDAPPAQAKGEPVDCSKKANKNKPECKKNREDLGDNELYYAGYWLARAGKYEQALTYLNQAKNPNDPRFLTYIGFATRKLGDHDKAMGYYDRALKLDANYVIARAYLGEAFLDKGELSKAVEQLGEIEKRCGTSCLEHQELGAQIEAYKTKAAVRG
jgi:tetratricopeptide (TPR) repeat protein